MVPRWQRKILLGDVWQNDSMTFEQQRDEIVLRFRALLPWAKRIDLSSFDTPMEELVRELSETRNEGEFDEVWSEIYDWADTDHRLWINLYEPAQGARS